MSKSCISVEGIQVHIIKKSNVKRITIRILPPNGEAKIVAPKNCSNLMIKKIILQKLTQIKAAILEVRKEANRLQVSDVNELRDGSVHRLWGESYVLKFSSGSKNQIFIQDKCLILELKKDLQQDLRQEKVQSLLDGFYRDEMRKVLPEMVEKYASIVGELPNEYRIKKMRTRWGTCNIKARRIWLNSELAKKPLHCLEYVVVHELVHLLERYHNKRFYAFLDKFYPKWKEATRDLKKDNF